MPLNDHLPVRSANAATACRRTHSHDQHGTQQLTVAAPWLSADELPAQDEVSGGDPVLLVVGRPAISLSERLIAVSVPNHGGSTSSRWS
ncbi:hypothetical protein [[Actinomadura] parvosata]|uniref:hypothetical protein n=1 Tax=[Actinomadura] parvosata TaxID=1955412 RepID=UPI00164941FB